VSTHWTYEAAPPESDLEQGDILQLTGELRALFEAVHPHFCDQKYTGFIVCSQSCDLVRRGKSLSAKAGYIALAVIRPLVQVTSKLLSEVLGQLEVGIFDEKQKPDAKQFLQRLFNQNEQALGLFFLYQDADSGIAEEAVAFLRVSVSLRSEHYGKIIAARRGRLTAEFRAKLGWLIGNLYSRPATRDWRDFAEGQQQVTRMVNEALQDRREDGQGPMWIDGEVAAAAQKENLSLKSLDANALRRFKTKPSKDKAIEEIARHVKEILPDLDEGTRTKLLNRLSNSQEFAKLFRQR